MTAKLDPQTRNDDRGLYMGKTRRVVLDTKFGETASWIKAGTAGDVVWRNESGDLNIWNLEAGEVLPCNAIEIVTDGTIAGTLEATGSTLMLWGSTPADLKS